MQDDTSGTDDTMFPDLDPGEDYGSRANQGHLPYLYIAA